MQIDRARRSFTDILPALLAGAALAGCANRPSQPAPGAGGAGRTPASPPEVAVAGADAALPDALRALVARERRLDYLLLGEVHDHPLHHRLRAAWLDQLARAGRFAIALEQLDAERQAELDAARAAGLAGADLARAAGFDFRGWVWEDYAPLVALALRERLALVATNLSSLQTRAIARGTALPAPDSIPRGWGASDRAAMVAAIADGHCGLLPERAVAGSVDAQLARDATIAAALLRARGATGHPVVLIAGNGHVRRDIGVARHLAARAPGSRILCVGLLEPGEAALGPDMSPRFDLVVRTPAHPRADPCESLRRAIPPRTHPALPR